jgi:hypothetical protein
MDFERKPLCLHGSALSDSIGGATLSQVVSQVDCDYSSMGTECAGRYEVLAVAIRRQHSSGGFV